MKISTQYARIGLKQAAALVAYVLLIVALISRIDGDTTQLPELVAATLMLLTFVTSALISGSIVFFYPVALAIKGKLGDALELIAWTGWWLFALISVLWSVILLTR